MIGLMLGLFQVSIGYIPRTTPTEHSHRCCQILAAEDTAEELVSSGIHSEKLDWNGSNFGNMSNSSLNNSKCMSFNSFCVSCLQSIHYTVCVLRKPVVSVKAKYMDSPKNHSLTMEFRRVIAL